MSCKTKDRVGQDSDGKAKYQETWAHVGDREWTVWDETENSTGTDLYNQFQDSEVTSLRANLYWEFAGKTEDTEVSAVDPNKIVFKQGYKPSLKVFAYDILKVNKAKPQDEVPF